MKKKILFTLVLLLGIFFSFTSVDALTKINFNETANGKINTTLHFEEGFVGGIDITFNIVGDVEVKEFSFSNKIVSSNYEKSATYDKNNHTLTIRVTTGGIGTSHNLLNDKKELELGTMVFTTDAQESVNYKLSETAFKIVDNNWDSKTVEQSHITLGEKDEFIYKVATSNNNQTNENNTGSSGTNEESDPEEDQVTDQDPSEEIKDDGNSNGNSNENDDVTDEDDDTEEENNSNNQKPSTNTKEENENNKKQFDKYIVIIALMVFLIGILIYFLLVLRKKNKNTEE